MLLGLVSASYLWIPLDYIFKKNSDECGLLYQRIKTYLVIYIFGNFPPKDIVLALYRYIHFSELSGTLDTNNLKNNLVNVKW